MMYRTMLPVTLVLLALPLAAQAPPQFAVYPVATASGLTLTVELEGPVGVPVGVCTSNIHPAAMGAGVVPVIIPVFAGVIDATGWLTWSLPVNGDFALPRQFAGGVLLPQGAPPVIAGVTAIAGRGGDTSEFGQNLGGLGVGFSTARRDTGEVIFAAMVPPGTRVEILKQTPNGPMVLDAAVAPGNGAVNLYANTTLNPGETLMATFDGHHWFRIDHQ